MNKSNDQCPQENIPTRDTSADKQVDNTLIERLKNGDDSAFDEIMSNYGKEIYNFILRKIENPEDARDLAQETFFKVYFHINSYSERYNFRVWIYTIAINLVKNYLRWKKRHPAESIESIHAKDEGAGFFEVPSSGKNPAEIVTSNELANTVRQAINSLPEIQKDAIILCELHDLSIAEAAQILNTSVKSVESHLYRARKILRERLKRYLD